MLPSGQGYDLAPLFDLWKQWVCALMCSGLLAEIADTILNSRAPSLRRLYAFNWKLFAFWCRQQGLDTVHCPVSSILEFLQSHFFGEGSPILINHVTIGVISARVKMA